MRSCQHSLVCTVMMAVILFQVHDQPDVYETSELPESEQYEYHDGIESSDAIEVLHISAPDAHSKFANKILDASRVDFSDKISHKPRTGYQARLVLAQKVCSAIIYYLKSLLSMY